jgi:hypothetical protein
MAIADNLQQFKNNGVVNFANILSIPSKDRLPELVQIHGQQKIHALLVMMLADFANSFNLIRPMTQDQMVSTALELIATSYDDNLAIEDFAIFFSDAKSAKYGKVLDRMDQQTVFELFENYRQNRHKAYLQSKEEQNVKFKGYGPSDRICDDREEEQNVMRKEMNRYYSETVIKTHTHGKNPTSD